MGKGHAKRKSASDSAHSKKRKSKGKSDVEQESAIPVTLLSGFLGSGKTTLLRHVLTSKEHKLRIAVIVNDMAELNIDGEIIMRDPGQAVVKTKKEVVTLENGCICCTLRGDLIREIHRIQQTKQFDYVLIESTGIAEPQQVAESFCVDPETQALADEDINMLLRAARLDTCVTVVDAVNFPRYLASLKRFQDVFQDGLDGAEEAEGEKSISELIVEQVEFANVILLNKVDLVSAKDLQVAKTLIESLNPKAKVLTGSHGKIDIGAILNTKLFSLKDASESPGWLVSLKDGVTASEGEADEYGVSSFVFRSRKPFHPLRLHTFITKFFCFAEDWNSSLPHPEGKMALEHKNWERPTDDRYGSILRSKGTCWIAGRDDHEIMWHQTGHIIQLSPTSSWYCITDPEEWDGADSKECRALIESKLQTEDDAGNTVPYAYGDRRQELVFIGIDLQQSVIGEELNQCLLTDAEMAHHSTNLPHGAYPDPLFPILVPCCGAGSLFMIARSGQNQHIRIEKGFSLTVHNIALNVAHENEQDIKAVKVWLDKSDGHSQGILVATLRPVAYEQHSLSLILLPFDETGEEEETNRRIRVEVIPCESQSDNDMIESCEVHILGKIEPIPYQEDDDDSVEDTQEDDRDECV